MPLESLNNEQINIHDLTIEDEKKPESKAKQMFEDLQRPPYYDSEKEVWVEDKKYVQYSKDQLIGILTELKIDKESAIQNFENLKNSKFFDQKLGRWYNCLTERDSPIMGDDAYNNFDVILARLVKCEIDPSQVRYYPGGSFDSDDYEFSKFRLVDNLLQSKYDYNAAKKAFEKFIKSGYYNAKTDLVKHISSSGYFTEDQLLTVMAEAQYDKMAAEKRFVRLKENPKFYDAKKELWLSCLLDDPEHKHSEAQTSDQLLGIMCESLFEKPNLNTTTPPLPEERNY